MPDTLLQASFPFHLDSGFGQILQNTSAIVYVRDRQGRFIFANRRFLNQFGTSAPALLGKTCADLFPPDIARQYEANDARVLQQRQVMEFEEIAQVDGVEHTYISIKFPLFDAAGEVLALCGISTDITVRKQRENLLYDVAIKLCSIPDESLFDDVVRYLGPRLGVDFVMIGRLRDGAPDQVSAVAACEQGQLITDLSYDLLGTPCAYVVGREFYCVPRGLQQLFPGDNMLSSAGYESYAGYPLYDSADRPLGLLAVTHRAPLEDIPFVESILKIFSLRVAAALERRIAEQEKRAAEDERRRLSLQLKQAQKMEAIGQLTGGIAHDFNNLLTGVMGYISLAQERAEKLQDAKLDQYLERARSAGRKAGELIQQMLTFSRGEHGVPRVVELHQRLPEFVSLIESSLPAGVELELQLPAALPPVRIDPVHLEQVLMNLCINARDAMESRGRLTLSAASLQLDDRVCESCQQAIAGDYVAIRVQDTGHGILPAVMERMFEPFYSTKEIGKGSGMGLAMVHGILHECGGHVLVESHVGAGSTFTLLLPSAAAAVDDSAQSAASAAPRQQRLQGRVLVVDDQPVVSEFMQDLLANWGLDALVFNHPLQALERMTQQPDAVCAAIIDYTMPKMTGLELAAALARLRPQLPLILYSGYREEIDLAAAQKLGVLDVLRKPIDEQRLLHLLLPLVETMATAQK